MISMVIVNVYIFVPNEAFSSLSLAQHLAHGTPSRVIGLIKRKGKEDLGSDSRLLDFLGKRNSYGTMT